MRMAFSAQSYAYGLNHWRVDPDIRDILAGYWSGLPQKLGELDHYGQFCGSDVYELAYHVDHDARPQLIQTDLDGNRIDRVRLAPAERRILNELAPVMRAPYEGGSWHEHYAYGYLIADPGLFCVLTITQQTAYVIHKYAPQHDSWKEKLLTGEAFGATWMTEIQGGSDLGANRTQAKNEGDIWRLSSGDKYFASGAGLADIAVTTARPYGGRSGPKGLALFLVPRLTHDGKLNYKVRRLKDKSATRAVPSGEVELEGSEAWLVGNADQGIYYTLETLTVSRLTNATAAMGIARKAAFEVAGRMNSREAFGKKLREHPLVRRDMADIAVRMAGGTALAFHAVNAFDLAWKELPPYTENYHYARLLSHLAKNRTADHAAFVTRLAMELFGGVGFLEEYAIARWHREALITPIWEGPSNTQALDMLECMIKKSANAPFEEEMTALLTKANTPQAKAALLCMERVIKQILGEETGAHLQWYAKQALVSLADVAQVALLYKLGMAGHDRYLRLAELYSTHFILKEEYPNWAMTDKSVLELTL